MLPRYVQFFLWPSTLFWFPVKVTLENQTICNNLKLVHSARIFLKQPFLPIRKFCAVIGKESYPPAVPMICTGPLGSFISRAYKSSFARMRYPAAIKNSGRVPLFEYILNFDRFPFECFYQLFLAPLGYFILGKAKVLGDHQPENTAFQCIN